MEESIQELIDSVHPRESLKFEGLENLSLTWKYLDVPEPNPKKVRIFYRNLRVRGEGKARASICMVHGFAEHSGKLLNVAAYFALEGFEVHLIDLRSYGLSGGARCGHSLIEFQQDIKVLLEQARSDIPCFLYGHSMGGLLVTTVLINNPGLSLSGAILSAPLYETSSAEIDPVKQCAMGQLTTALKEMVLNSYIAPACLSKDDEFLKNVFKDTKLMPLFGIELGLSLLDHMAHVLKSAHRIKHPVVFFHGDADILTYAKTTEKVFNMACSADKTFRIVPGAYHEPHHDLMRDTFIPELVQWANQRVKNLPLGKICGFKAGLPGLPSSHSWKKILVWVFALAYLIIAVRIKVSLNPIKLLKLWNLFQRVFWPVKLILG